MFVDYLEPNGRAAKSGCVFVGDQVKMVSATFGEDMWTCENVGLTRVLSCINVRNTKPVRFVLECPDPNEELRRRDIAFRETTEVERQQDTLVRMEPLPLSNPQQLSLII